jgi:chromatin assembly factor 1 subunit B
VRPSPLLYKLPDSVPEETKENKSEQSVTTGTPESPRGLPYRSVFAVLTLDSVLIYDTHHLRPLCIARGLHYAGLTDCTWSADGRNLIVSSTDGYVSILTFDEKELGEIYTPPPKVVLPPKGVLKKEPPAKPETVPVVSLPPCEPGQTATLEARPAKRAKTRITPTLLSTPVEAPTVTLSPPTGDTRKSENVVCAEQPKAKKKRIQPTLVSVNP